MTLSKAIRNNIAELKRLTNSLRGENKEKAEELTQLYEQRKISQFTTAQKIIKGFADATTAKEQKRVNKKYDEVIQNNRINNPLNVRMKKSTVSNIVAKSRANNRTYMVETMVYSLRPQTKNPSFTIKRIISGSEREFKYYPVEIDSKERAYEINTNIDIDSLVGQRILKVDDYSFFKKLLVAFSQDHIFLDKLFTMSWLITLTLSKS